VGRQGLYTIITRQYALNKKLMNAWNENATPEYGARQEVT
jgi:hypothetical protein